MDKPTNHAITQAAEHFVTLLKEQFARIGRLTSETERIDFASERPLRVGFVGGDGIGPIIAALFVTIWDIYGVAFKDVLPESPTTKDPGENSAGNDKSSP